MIYLLLILWWLSGCIPFLYALRKEGLVEMPDVGMAFVAGVIGPFVPFSMFTAWLVNKF